MTTRTADPPPVGDAGSVLLPHILSIAKAIRQLCALRLADCGVVPGQDQYLLCFDPNEALSVATIAERLSVRASTVSKMTDILGRKGWVVRRTDDEDARKVLVHLTEAGLAVRGAVRAVGATMEAELSAALGTDEKMLSCLAKLDAVLVQRLRRYR